jgi:hypothetical protein
MHGTTASPACGQSVAYFTLLRACYGISAHKLSRRMSPYVYSTLQVCCHRRWWTLVLVSTRSLVTSRQRTRSASNPHATEYRWIDGQPTSNRKMASWRTEEMQRPVTCGIVESRSFFFDRSRRIDGIPWSLMIVRTMGFQSEKHFRTINVQWIGQWGLFSHCGSSKNQ